MQAAAACATGGAEKVDLLAVTVRDVGPEWGTQIGGGQNLHVVTAAFQRSGRVVLDLDTALSKGTQRSMCFAPPTSLSKMKRKEVDAAIIVNGTPACADQRPVELLRCGSHVLFYIYQLQLIK